MQRAENAGHRDEEEDKKQKEKVGDSERGTEPAYSPLLHSPIRSFSISLSACQS